MTILSQHRRKNFVRSPAGFVVTLLASFMILTSFPMSAVSAGGAAAEGSVSASQGELTAASGTNRFVAWSDETPGNDEVFFKRSTDSGATWGALINLSTNAGDSINVELAVSGTAVYVAWVQISADHKTSDVLFRRSIDNGVSWGPKTKISSVGSTFAPPHMATSGSILYIVWYELDGDTVKLRRSEDNGATWKAIVSLANNGREAPLVAASAANVYVVWHSDDEEGSPSDIYFRRSSNNGADWTATVNLSTNVGTSLGMAIAATASNVYVAWYDTTPGNFEILFKRSTNNGATWKPVKNLSNNADHSDGPDIAVSGSNVFVVWDDSVGGSDDILLRRSADNGNTWKAAKNLSNSAGLSNNAAVVASGSAAYVAWIESKGATDDVYIRRSADNGNTWKAAKNLSNNAGDSGGYDLAVSNSEVYFVWRDYTPGNADILLRRSLDNGATWNTSKNLSSNSGSSGGPSVAA